MPDESLDILIKTTADTSGGKHVSPALNQTGEAAQRLQRIFESTKGDSGIAESVKGMARGAEEAERGLRRLEPAQASAKKSASELGEAHKELHRMMQLVTEQSPLLGVALEGAFSTVSAAIMAATVVFRELAQAEPASPAKARDTAASLAEGFGGMAGPISEAVNAANEAQTAYNQWSQHSHEDFMRAAKDLDRKQLAAAPAKQLGAPGAFGDVERAAVTVGTGETARARNRGGRALTQQERDAISAGDQIEPAMKALLQEVAKMQDKHVNGLKQAVEVITGTSQTVDRLVGLMKTLVAHQEQLRADMNAHAQQLAAWARTTQIP